MKRCVTKRLGRTATALLAAIGASSVALSAAAQAPVVLDNKQIEVVYVEPSNANNRQIYEALRKRRVLEELKAFLAPLRLPADQPAQGQGSKRPPGWPAAGSFLRPRPPPKRRPKR